MISHRKKLLNLFLIVVFIFSFNVVAFAEEGDQSLTTDDSAIKVEVHHSLLKKEGDVAQVREVIKFSNDGDKTYIGKEGEGEQREVLTVSLPQNYTNLKIMGVPENQVIIEDGKLITTNPVKPGMFQLNLDYTVPSSQYGEIYLDQRFYYLTEVLYILSPRGDFEMSGDGIVSAGIQNIEGEEYNVFYSELSRPGERFSLTARSAQGGGNGDRTAQAYNSGQTTYHSASHIARWMGSPVRGVVEPHLLIGFIIVLGMGTIGATGMLIREKRKEKGKQEAEEKLATLYDRLVIKESRLMNKIKDLDQQLAEGEVSGDNHNELRDQYKKMLVEVKLKIRELEDLDES